MDVMQSLRDIKQGVDSLHKQKAKAPRYGQQLVMVACAQLARSAGNHYLANKLVQKAAVQPATTSTATWASELVNSNAGQLVMMASARSAFAAIMARSHQIGILGATQQSVVVLAPPPAARFVDEANPIPVTQGSISGLPASPKKLAGIVGFTGEQAKRSNIDRVARLLLTESLAKGLDAAAFSDQGPFGLFQGVTPTPGGATPLEDVRALLAAMVEPSPEVCFVTSVANYPAFLAGVGENFPYASFPSSTLSDELVAVDPSGLAGAISGGEIDVSNEALLHMSDDPVAVIEGSPTRSLWQTDSYAMRAAADMAWKARAGAVAFVSAVSW